MDPRIIDGIMRMIANGNYAGAIALFGLGAVMCVLKKAKG